MQGKGGFACAVAQKENPICALIPGFESQTRRFLRIRSHLHKLVLHTNLSCTFACIDTHARDSHLQTQRLADCTENIFGRPAHSFPDNGCSHLLNSRHQLSAAVRQRRASQVRNACPHVVLAALQRRCPTPTASDVAACVFSQACAAAAKVQSAGPATRPRYVRRRR